MDKKQITLKAAQQKVDEWISTRGANQTGIDLTKAFEKNMEKKTKRDSMRHKGNKKLKGTQ